MMPWFLSAIVLSAGARLPNFAAGEHKTSRAIKAAPLESLFAQFCLHCLWFGNCNIRGMLKTDLYIWAVKPF